ncbi:hypothetical protein HPB51_015757 [Rhipicephalus microplus]|uniref:HTH CENPB-type domain-containing protein n=1 Tax=Rhipicephalus microplus TaxID=6941 RepID=A0A9J6EUD7_RHIMP|nr:hypothetical protein HPB51_015757 [Rhipicephalus microplus]
MTEQKAKDLAFLLGRNDFQGGSGWLQRFKERHIVGKAVTGRGSAPFAMAPIYELVGSVADHMATKVENAFDFDATRYQPPVASLPVLRLLQPMTHGRGEADFNFQGDLWKGATPVEPSQLPTGTDAEKDSRLTSD